MILTDIFTRRAIFAVDGDIYADLRGLNADLGQMDAVRRGMSAVPGQMDAVRRDMDAGLGQMNAARQDMSAVSGRMSAVRRDLVAGWEMLPNKSPEPTAVGAVSSAIAVRVASRRWLSFFR